MSAVLSPDALPRDWHLSQDEYVSSLLPLFSYKPQQLRLRTDGLAGKVSRSASPLFSLVTWLKPLRSSISLPSRERNSRTSRPPAGSSKLKWRLTWKDQPSWKRSSERGPQRLTRNATNGRSAVSQPSCLHYSPDSSTEQVHVPSNNP